MYNLKVHTGNLQYTDIADDDFSLLLELARGQTGTWWIARLSDFVILATSFPLAFKGV